MALSDELAKPSSERFCLIKIIPSLRLNTFLTVKSGTIYQTTFSRFYEISAVSVDGFLYAQVDAVDPASEEFYYDVDTGVFEINFGAAIGSKQATMDFVLRFTDSENGVINEAGVKNAVDSYQWLSRIANAPEFNVSCHDMLNGVTSISGSEISIVNDDLWFNDFMGGEFSFANKDFAVFLCVNEVLAAKFNGKMRGILPSGNNVSIKVYDNLYYLSEQATMGDRNDDAYINLDTYAAPDPAAVGICIPYVNGKTRYRSIPFDDATTVRRYHFDTTGTLQAYCTDTTTSRKWSCVRIATDSALKVASYGTPSSVSFTAGYYSYGSGSTNRALIAVSGGTNNLELLDFVEFKKSGVYYPATVVRMDDSGNYDCLVWDSVAAAGTYTVTDAPTSTMGVMIVQNGMMFYPVGGWDGSNNRDYRFLGTVLDSGNTRFDLEFQSGFDTKHPGMVPLDYTKDKIYIRVSETESASTHGNVVNRILLAAGLDVNATSISDANTDLDAKVNLAIPQFGDKIPKSYASYLGLIMQSTVGYVFQNSDTNEMHYNLFAAPVAGDVLLSSEIINLSVSLEIADMAESVRAYNEGNFYKHQEFVSAPPFVVSVSVSSTKSKYFHGIDNQVSVESCLALPYYTATRRIELARNEQMTVNVEVASKFMNKNIGDDISIADDRIPGTKTVVNGYSCSLMKIIGIRYGVESLIFTCINVRND